MLKVGDTFKLFRRPRLGMDFNNKRLVRRYGLHHFHRHEEEVVTIVEILADGRCAVEIKDRRRSFLMRANLTVETLEADVASGRLVKCENGLERAVRRMNGK